jgi:glutamate synthase (NADPH/NADH) small chain
LRLGARSASIFYRRTETEMPARKEEVAHAMAEGVNFQFLVNPLRIEGDDKGWVRKITCSRMELGEMDASGRRRPVPIPGSEFEAPVSMVIIAVGTTANPLVQSTTPDLATNKRGYIVADNQTQRTSKRGVFAGGDIVTGAATVILAMGAGRNAAKSIHEFLTTGVF